MNTIGTRAPVTARCLCSSRPLIFGNCISNTRQAVCASLPDSRNSSAEGNASAARPADRIRAFRARQIPGSSSTIETKHSPFGFSIAFDVDEDSSLEPHYRLATGSSIGSWGRLLVLSGRYAESLGHANQVGQRFGLHFSHDLAAVDLDSSLAGAQLSGDLFIEQPRDDELHDLALAGRQGGLTPSQVSRFRLFVACGAVAFDGLVDCIQQDLAAERLGEEFQGSGLHSFHGHRNVSVAGDKDEGDRKSTRLNSSHLGISY